MFGHIIFIVFLSLLRDVESDRAFGHRTISIIIDKKTISIMIEED